MMSDDLRPVNIEKIGKQVVVPRKFWEPWIERHNWTHHQLGRGELPPGYDGLAQFQLHCINSDEVLWCYTFLKDPDDPDLPWTFFEYQEESARYKGNTIHQCGAEVGKTREIIGRIMHQAFTVARGGGLVAAPQLAHLLEIIDEMQEQLNLNPLFNGSLVKHRKHPHHMMKFSNKFVLHFRPTGHDGTSLRGVHVKTFAVMDESAKAKNPDIWKEFWRAGKPGCEFKVYSVPDGDRSTVYSKICARADGKLKERDKGELDKHTPQAFKKFHWGKPLMPPPFWTAERRRFYIDMYGGEDSPGYQQNVLGNQGDPENSVFPWHQFKLTLKELPEYRCLKILVDDSQNEVTLFGTQYLAQVEDGVKSDPKEAILVDSRMSKSRFDIVSEVKSFFGNIPGLTFGGADLGYSHDPTEIYIKLIIGKTHRLIARLQLKSVTYDQQADAIDALDDIFDAGKNEMLWGVDFGNAGSAVVHMLHNQANYAGKDFEDRLTGWLFGGKYEAVDEDGERLLDRKTDKPYKLTGKELSTDLLVKKMQRQELEYPYDPDLMLFYPSHTYREGQRMRIFKKEDDHTIDADRAGMLSVVLAEEQGDMFASGN